MKQRIQYFDFLRGLAIMMVVAIHTSRSSSSLSIDSGIRQIINCAVPLFLAISGFFLAKKEISERKSYYNFLKKQISKVYFPALIWSLPLLVLSLYRGEDVLKSVCLFLVCGYSIYYFIALIIQYYIMLPILQHLTLFGGFVALIATMLSIFIFKYAITIKLPLIIYGGIFTMWLVFFVIGILLSKMKSRDYKISIWIVLAIISFVCALFEMNYFYNKDEVYWGIKPSSHIMSLCIIILLFSQKVQSFYKENIFTKTIAKIGSVSFGIYLIHCYFISFIEKFNYGWIFYWMLTVAASYCVVAGVRAVAPQVAKRIGFTY